MLTFELFIDDDRYMVPTLRILTTQDATAARTLAKQALGESAHHLGVELRAADRRLLGLGSLQSRAPGRGVAVSALPGAVVGTTP